MKKRIFLSILFCLACVASFRTNTVFAEIEPGLDRVDDSSEVSNTVDQTVSPGHDLVDDGLNGPNTGDPIATIQTFIKGLLTLLGMIFVIPGVIGLYLCPSLGASLLSKKYAPTVHPALSWIPIVRIYPLTKSAGISGWWSFSFLGLIVWFLPIYVYVYFKLAKELGRGVGTTLGLFFLPHFMIAYLGLKDAGKSTWPAWVFGLSGVVLVFIFFAWTISSLIFNILSGSTITG